MFITSLMKSLPSNSCLGEAAMAGGGGSATWTLAPPVTVVSDNAALANAFVLFLTSQAPAGLQQEDDFAVVVQDITAFCMNLFTDTELTALADRLDDATLAFVSGAGAVANVVETIRS